MTEGKNELLARVKELHTASLPTELTDLEPYYQHGESLLMANLGALPAAAIATVAQLLLMFEMQPDQFFIERQSYGSVTVYKTRTPAEAEKAIADVSKALDRNYESFKLYNEAGVGPAANTSEDYVMQQYFKKIKLDVADVPWMPAN